MHQSYGLWLYPRKHLQNDSTSFELLCFDDIVDHVKIFSWGRDHNVGRIVFKIHVKSM